VSGLIGLGTTLWNQGGPVLAELQEERWRLLAHLLILGGATAWIRVVEPGFWNDVLRQFTGKRRRP